MLGLRGNAPGRHGLVTSAVRPLARKASKTTPRKRGIQVGAASKLTLVPSPKLLRESHPILMAFEPEKAIP